MTGNSFCYRCGHAVVAGAKVCQSCGAVVRAARTAPAVDPSAVSTAEEALDTDATVDVRVIRAQAARLAEEERAARTGMAVDATEGASSLVSLTGEWPNLPPATSVEEDGAPSTPAEVDVQASATAGGVAAAADATVDPAGAPAVSFGAPARRSMITLERIDRSWGARWRRGVMFARLSYQLLRSHKGLLWVPVLAASAIVAVFLVDGLLSLVLPSALGIIVFLAALAAAVTVATVSQAVIIHRVGTVAQGGDESNGQALKAVLPKWRALFAWGCLSFSVGVAIRWLERGRGPFGWLLRIVAVALNVAWSAATFFVVPVILYEDLAVRPAIARSRQLLRASWGEGVIGVGIMALFFNLVGLAAVVLAALLSFAHLVVLAFLVLLVAVVGINILSCVATPIFTLTLYRFAVDGSVAFGLAPADLAGAFRPRRRRWSGTSAVA